jgi:hypothetical protein
VARRCRTTISAGVLAAAVAVLGGACDGADVDRRSAAASTRPRETPLDVTTAAPATIPPPATTTLPPTTTTTTTPPVRRVTTQPWVPMAATIVGSVTLVHPAERVERVGFHQSNHEGARELAPLDTAVQPATLESRERLSAGRTAADVVVAPDVPIRAPVTGRVLRAGTYVLYCKYSDDYVVIEPDSHPGWEVKILHIDGEQVQRGQRVEAGVTQLAPRATQLPFESQVDELRSADPAWPHVHIEVVDPSIPNVPSPGGGC